jgi:hypothetical protein
MCSTGLGFGLAIDADYLCGSVFASSYSVAAGVPSDLATERSLRLNVAALPRPQRNDLTWAVAGLRSARARIIDLWPPHSLT